MSWLNWISRNLLTVILVLMVGFLLFKNDFTPKYSSGLPVLDTGFAPSAQVVKQSANPTFNSDNRVVLKETNLSLLVKDVSKTSDQVIDYAKSLGGYMVSSTFNRPEEAPFATVTVRVPTGKLDEALKYLRGLAVKITSENLYGTDVTEQYVDIEARLGVLHQTQSKLNELLKNSTAVQDVLSVQRELSNIQSQIDDLMGQKKSIDQNAQLTKVTTYLSTDELALPYVPDKAFRPNLIFKQAVRSLVDTLRWLGEAAIWLVVYSVIWLPLLAGIYYFKKWRRNRPVS